MSNIQGNLSVRRTYDDEIDLFELLQSLWQQRQLILLVMCVTFTVAAAYAFLAPSVYEARASVLAPTLGGIAVLNEARSEAGLETYNQEDIYKSYKASLQGEKVRRQVFDELCLPSISEKSRSVGEGHLWERFNKSIEVKAPDVKSRPGLFEVTLRHEQAQTAADWLSSYLARAADNTRAELKKDLQAGVAIRRKSIKQKIDALKTTVRQEREDRIVRLREALVVAEAVGGEAPRVTLGKASSSENVAEFMDGNMAYTRGARAIRAELAVLKARKDDAPFVAGLRDLEKQLAVLNKVTLAEDQIAVYSADALATAPESPIKPRKRLICALGAVLGGLLGVLVALIRSAAIKKRKQCLSTESV